MNLARVLKKLMSLKVIPIMVRTLEKKNSQELQKETKETSKSKEELRRPAVS